MIYERIMGVLYVGSTVRVVGLAPGVGTVEAVQPHGALIRFADSPFPNAYFWFEVVEIDGVQIDAVKSTTSEGGASEVSQDT